MLGRRGLGLGIGAAALAGSVARAQGQAAGQAQGQAQAQPWPDRPIRLVPFHGLVILSVQSLLAMNVGWDGERTDRAFKNLNTAESVIGLILLTFFVGAYTRMVLS